AVAVSPEANYGLYRVEIDGREFHSIIVDNRSESVFKKSGAKKHEKLGSSTGRELYEKGIAYKHPFMDREGRVVTAD
ncbi:MAG: hypothetical protein GTN76_14900, partial [Candidatus Aenigmarchaeota archaeon]|nr:hypothetical protein [Candidatus Aenigmarchaeota archaeon]